MIKGPEGVVLPWGWWLLVRRGWIEDAEGRRWRSVRAAFWEGHLRFPDTPIPDHQEMLLRALLALAAGRRDWHETAEDLFGGDLGFWRFYMAWLASVDLVVLTGPGLSDARVSDLGRSVVLMLQATRDPAWVELPMAAIVEAVRDAGRGSADASREAALQAFERQVARRPYQFRREAIGRTFAVTLVGVSVTARMPMRSVIWSLSFKDADVRDDLYAWLADRVDRWDDWGRLAYEAGAAALNQQLLRVMIARKTPI